VVAGPRKHSGRTSFVIPPDAVGDGAVELHDGRAGQAAELAVLVAAAVALVEDQVDDGENGVETLAEQVNWWHAKRDPRRLTVLSVLAEWASSS
jgi:hypothetical protein